MLSSLKNNMRIHYKLTFLLVLISLSNAFSQVVDSSEYLSFKRFLPRVMQSIQAMQDIKAPEQSLVSESKCTLPWELKGFEESEFDEFIGILQSKTTFEIQKKSETEDRLNVVSTLQNFREKAKLDNRFQNLSLYLADIKIVNGNAEDIYLRKNKNILQPNENGTIRLIMQGAQMNALLPVKPAQEGITGEIKVVLKEKSGFSYKALSSDEEELSFEINNQEIELVKIKESIAILRMPKKIEDLKIFSVNELNQKHSRTSILCLPEAIYLKSIEPGATKEDLETYAKNYSYEDFENRNTATVFIYESSGKIENLYIYHSDVLKTKSSCVLNFSID